MRRTAAYPGPSVRHHVNAHASAIRATISTSLLTPHPAFVYRLKDLILFVSNLIGRLGYEQNVYRNLARSFLLHLDINIKKEWFLSMSDIITFEDNLPNSQ